MPVYKRGRTGKKVKDNEPGKWYVDFQEDGQRKRKVLRGVTTKTEAKRIEEKMRIAMLDGTAEHQEALDNLTRELTALRAELEAQKSNKGKQPAIQFDRFTTDVYLPHKKSENKDTYYIFEYISRIYISHFGDMILHNITEMEVMAFCQKRAEGITKRGKPRSHASLNRDLNVLSGLFSLAVTRKYIKRNPCTEVERYRVDDGLPIVLEEGEEVKLLGALTGKREKFKPVVLLALHTGLRLHEVAKLEWKRVNLSDNEEEREITVLGKGKKWAKLPLNDVAYGVLKDLRAKCDGKGLVFSERGLSASNIGHSISGICDEIGLPHITMHKLRHTFASTLIRRGDVNVEQVRDLMRHADIGTTMIYSHLNQKSRRETVKKLEKAGKFRPDDTNADSHSIEK